MARFIPSIKSELIENTGEKAVFEALKNLPNEYIVFYSFKWSNLRSQNKKMGEADFVIFHPEFGFIVVEVKAGGVYCVEGQWYYQNGLSFENPLEQARQSMFFIRELFKVTNKIDAPNYYSIVWFPSIKSSEVGPVLPPDFERFLVFTKENLFNPEESLRKVFNLNKQKSDYPVDTFIRILAPTFNAIMSASRLIDENNQTFNLLTREQSRLLDFIEEQEHAVIHGTAGTGKTMIAVEKANRLAYEGQKVLFLCYNAFLRQFVSNTMANELVEVENVHSLASRFLRSAKVDEEDLLIALQRFSKQNFPYDSVVIDEGQDFLSENIVKLESLTRNSFYVFYDKNQLVQKDEIPSWVLNADCKLNLTKNCRNTVKIAKTSVLPIGVEPRVYEHAALGTKPYIFVGDQSSVLNKIDSLINKLVNEESVKIKDIVILTVKSEDKSIISDSISLMDVISQKNSELLFTTARKFKGLESEIVILVDLDPEYFETEVAKRMFYVASSRAKSLLYLMFNSDNDGANRIAQIINNTPLKDGQNALIRALDGQRLN